MPKTSTNDTIAGLKRVVDWLIDHPDLPITRVDYASNDVIELTLESGGYELLAAAVRAATTVEDPEITVADASTDDAARQWCQLLISGWIRGNSALPPIRVVVAGICFDKAATALRNSLGTPPIPGEHIWDTTADHLRSLLPGGDR